MNQFFLFLFYHIGFLKYKHSHYYVFLLLISNSILIYYAAVYLLTSNDDLYKRSSRCFLKSRLYLRDFRIQGISPYNYTLFAYARLLYSGKTNLPMTELVDGWSVPPEAFRFIVNAVIIAKHGVETLNITKTTTIKDTETEE